MSELDKLNSINNEVINSFNDNITNDLNENSERDNYSNVSNNKKIQNKFLENVIKYLQTDDIIRKKTSEYKDNIKILKESKEDLEDYVIRYLEKEDEDYIDIKGKGKLIKKKTVTKGAIKIENVKESIYEELTQKKLVEEDEEMISLIDNILEKIDKKRPVKEKTVLKRTFIKK